jgi:hypothetical protein
MSYLLRNIMPLHSSTGAWGHQMCTLKHMTGHAIAALAITIAVTACTYSPPPIEPAPPIELTAQEDHQRLMGLLGIDEIRPGRNGMDPNHPDYANYDEETSNPYPDLPPLLITEDGRAVTSADMWNSGRNRRRISR